MVTRNLGKIQEALQALNPVEQNLNELLYYQKYLKSPSHSTAQCTAVRSSLDALHQQHEAVVNALIAYGNSYQSLDEELAKANNPDYQPLGVCYHFTYVSAPEHEKGFWEKTWNQVILGDYSDDVTWLGTVLSIGAAFVGVDAPMDVRDLTANVSKGEWGWAMLNVVSLLPVVGVLGTGGKTVSKGAKALSRGDNVADLLKQGYHADDLTRAVGKSDILLRTSKSGRDYLLTSNSLRIINKSGMTDITVNGVRYIPDFTYVKKSAPELKEMRDVFNASVRKEFVQDLAIHHVDELKKLNFTDIQIEQMRLKGKLPDGFQIHHKFSLDDGGTNDFSNLILIRNDQHTAFTAYQNSFTRSKNFLENGQTQINWVIPTGSVHIPGVPIRPFKKYGP